MTFDLRLDPGEVALLTDLYELTVSAAFFDHGFNDIASFELAMRRMPPGRGFMIAAGVERLAEALEQYRFDARGDRASRVAETVQAGISRIPFETPLHRFDPRAARRNDLFPRRTDPRSPRATHRGPTDRDAGAQPARIRFDRRDQGGAMLRGRGRQAAGGLRSAPRAGRRRVVHRGALELPGGLSRHRQRARGKALRDSRIRHHESQLRDGA